MPKIWLVTMDKGDEIKKVTVHAPSHAASREKALAENPDYTVIVSQSYEKD